MFDSLTDKLQGVFRRLGGRGTITEKDLDEALREVRLALLEADVNYKVVKDFVAAVRERALGADVTKSLSPMQQIIDIVNQQMIEVLGGGHAALQKAKSPPTVVVLVDTVGYVQIDNEAQASLKSLHKALSPNEVLLVADAMTGQEAVHAAEEFNKAVPLTGLILTKLDGDARGGAALSIRAVTGVP